MEFFKWLLGLFVCVSEMSKDDVEKLKGLISKAEDLEVWRERAFNETLSIPEIGKSDEMMKYLEGYTILSKLYSTLVETYKNETNNDDRVWEPILGLEEAFQDWTKEYGKNWKVPEQFKETPQVQQLGNMLGNSSSNLQDIVETWKAMNPCLDYN